MEIIIGETQLRCHEDGRIERLDKRNEKWRDCKGSNHKGYLQIEIETKMYYFHRIIYKCFHSDMDDTLCIDHINHTRNDNRLENLRLVTQQQNHFNRGEVKGYTKIKNGFQGRIMLNGVRITKYFKTEDEACAWYLEQKAILHIIHQ
jgi:hypothetical protein